MQELWFLHSAYPLMLVDICMKFHDASLYGLKVIDRTRWRQDFVKDKVQREKLKLEKSVHGTRMPSPIVFISPAI